MSKLIILMCLCTLSNVALAEEKQVLPSLLRICDDDAEWPPFAYFSRTPGEKSKLKGYSIEVLATILKPIKQPYQIDMINWNRCKYEVKNSKKYHMLVDSSLNKQRRNNFLYSDSYYDTHTYYFYAKAHHPNGIHISSFKDLKQYRLAGMQGYNYATYGLNESDISIYKNSQRKIFNMLLHNRADLYLERIEIIAGFAALGENFLENNEIGYAPLPNTAPMSFHMLFPKTSQGKKLRDFFNHKLKQLKSEGILERLLNKHLEPVLTNKY
ncbi:substrate-binding periplasmic protein [Zooshikella sp. RANM57]|uniref:substrate-binding periplasmic protein n=1 Tax=Zooshikella sp. RANM57 TaxID=3425863 RepID=UPI003D6FFDCE